MAGGLVVLLGAAAMDTLFKVERLPNPDEMVFAEEGPYTLPGGSTANIAVALARLGVSSRFIGKMGDDENGRQLLGAFKQDQVDTSFVLVTPDARTAQTIIAVDRAGSRVIFSLGGAAILESPHEFRSEALDGASALYIGEAFPDVAEAVMRAARERRVPVVYGPGGAFSGLGLARLGSIVASADYLILNSTEALVLTGERSVDDASARLVAAGAGRVIVTLGAHGAASYALRTDGPNRSCAGSAGCPDTVREVDRVYHGGFPMEAIDTTGAGDAFTAGFMCGVAAGRPVVECLKLGNACGALAVAKIGAREAMPTWSEVHAFLTSHSRGPDGPLTATPD